MASKEVMLWRNITLLCSRGPRRRKRDGWSWSIWGPPPPLTPLGSPRSRPAPALHPRPQIPSPHGPHQTPSTPGHARPCERSRSDSRTFPHTGWSSTIQTAETVPRMAMPPLQRAHHRHPHPSHAQDWGDVLLQPRRGEGKDASSFRWISSRQAKGKGHQQDGEENCRVLYAMFISDKLVPSSVISNTYRNCMNTLVNKISNLKLDLFFENHIFVYGLLPIPRISETCLFVSSKLLVESFLQMALNYIINRIIGQGVQQSGRWSDHVINKSVFYQ